MNKEPNFFKQYPSLMDLSNPCMKCGSVQCSFCSDDIKGCCLDKEKVKQAINKIFTYPEDCMCDACQIIYSDEYSGEGLQECYVKKLLKELKL